MSILEAHNVSVRYITGDFKEIGLKEYVMRKLKGNYQVNEFWADQNVNFTLEKGDMLGIIGSNGAGKSTLLKTISGIMEPSVGRIHREGSIAALLELGSGFDGDLTVRENTYLRGAMMGYTRKFMDDTYEQIIEFAELKEFQDRPFKQLSSGMKARLAFSIASLVRPDILILDEVLSVGDGAFRKKSEAKMQEVIGGGATTILVSHSLAQIREMCNKVLWLHKGEQIVFGDDVQNICDRYQAFLDGGQIDFAQSAELALSTSETPQADAQSPAATSFTVKESGKSMKLGARRMDKCRSTIPWRALLLIFIISTIFRGLLASNVSEFATFYDEMRHFKLAQGIALGNGLYIRGALYAYKEILYSLLISPVFMLVKDPIVARRVILWINAGLMSSTIVPIYLLGRRYLKNSAHVWLLVVYGLGIGELCYTFQVIQENLNYPLMMWFFLAFSSVIIEKKGSLIHICGLGALAFFVSICKEMNLAFIIGIALFFLLQFFLHSNERWEILKTAGTLFGTFLVLKIGYGTVMNLLLSEAVSGAAAGRVLDSLLNIIQFGTLKQLIYPAVLYVLFTILATGIFPLPMLAGNWRNLQKEKQDLLIFSSCCLFVFIGTICALIVPNENLGSLSIRIHTRYYFYLFILIELLFLCLCEDDTVRGQTNRMEPLFILICVSLFLIFLPIVPVWGSFIDGISARVWGWWGSDELMVTTQRCILIAVVVLGMCLIYGHRTRRLLGVTCFLLTASMILSTNTSIETIREVKSTREVFKSDAALLNNYFSVERDKWNAEKNILIVGEFSSDLILECYLQEEYRLVSYGNDFKNVGQVMDFSKLPFLQFGTKWTDDAAQTPQFIISGSDIPLDGYDEVNLGLAYYHLLQWNGGDVKLRSSESGIYADRWVGEEAAEIKLMGSIRSTSAELALTVDNNKLPGSVTVVNYTDGTGYKGTFLVPDTDVETVIKLPVYKSAESTFYVVTLEPEKAVQPNTADKRFLSFRLWDYEITEECEAMAKNPA